MNKRPDTPSADRGSAVLGQTSLPPRQRRALIVDDHDDARRLFGLMLESKGWVCEFAADGREAVQRATTLSFDVILMDLRMPVLSGLDAIRELRVQGVKSKILALTADAFRSARDAALSAGADAYLAKPVPREILVGTCEKMLTDEVRGHVTT